MYVQTKSGSFGQINVPLNSKKFQQWQSVRVGYVTKSSNPDLIITGRHEGKKKSFHYLRIFKPIDKAPWFNFGNPYLTMKLPHAAPDLELLDVNNDGYIDICKSSALCRGMHVCFCPGPCFSKSYFIFYLPHTYYRHRTNRSEKGVLCRTTGSQKEMGRRTISRSNLHPTH